MSEKKPHIPRRSSPTSFDVARKAGVSQAAVSYVFNLISTRLVEHIPTIIFPSSPPGYLAARHLLERGHRRLGIVHPSDPLLEEIFQQRLEGMRSALAERADTALAILPLAPTLPDTRSLVETYLTCTDHPTGGYYDGNFRS